MAKQRSLIDEYFQLQLKYEKKYGNNTIVLMEVGSFFEVYGVDNEIEKIGKAKEVANLLNIQLTRKDKSILENSRKNPLLCGVPSVSFERYLDTLLKLNRFTIVLYEQVTPPPKVTRKITKIISPGTQLKSLNEENSYLMSIVIQEERNRVYTVGCSYIDLSTGKNAVVQSYGTLDDKAFSLDAILKLIKATQPKEILINTLDVTDFTNEKIVDFFELHSIVYHIFNDKVPSVMLNINYQNEVLKNIFENDSFLTPIETLHLERMPTATLSYILMIKFISEHDRDIIKHIDKPKREIDNFYLYLGASVLAQLNIIPDKLSEAESNINSLYTLISKTSTPMGKRLLKDRLLNPILDIPTLKRRYREIETFLPIYKDIEKYLNEIIDIERLHRKLSLQTLQPTEFNYLHLAYNSIENLLNMLNSLALKEIGDLMLSNEDWVKFIEFRSEYLKIFDIDELAKYNLNKLDESFFNVGINENIDKIDFEIKGAKKRLNEIGERISNLIEPNSYYLKIEFNEKDGFHLTVTKAKFKLINREKIKEFKYKELTNIVKIKSEEIESISDKIISLKLKLSTILKDEYLKYLSEFHIKYKSIMSRLVYFVSTIDVIKSQAKVANLYDYCKPNIIDSEESFLEAIDLRHPLIEQINYNSRYIPNSIFLGNKNYASPLGKETITYKAKESSEYINGMLIYGVNASGKCFAKDTEILMYSGKTKFVQDIKKDDLLMGDDSTPRRVLGTTKGRDKLYEIIPSKGESFKCNGAHILVLKSRAYNSMSWDKTNSRYRVNWFENGESKSKSFTVTKNRAKRDVVYSSKEEAFKEATKFRNNLKSERGKIVEISIDEFLKKPKRWQNSHYLYSVGVDFEPKDILIDPYIIGYWLGDGTTSKPEITTQNTEVVKYFKNYFQDKNIKVKNRGIRYNFSQDSNYNDDLTLKNCRYCNKILSEKQRIYCSNKCQYEDRKNRNFFLKNLIKYNLLNNKHIPNEFKINSKEVRLKLLAGILDADGSNQNGYSFDLTLKCEKLLDDVIFLARSLGFVAYKREKIVSGKKYFRTSIYGENLSEIPLLLKYKVPKNRKVQREDSNVKSFKIVSIGEGNYYGFELDRNHRFLLKDFTVTHNSSFMKSIGISMILAQSGFFVPAKEFSFSPYESLFTRISGDDNIFKGLSSFAVEMVELRDILNRANSKSLILGDEISHGTETTSAQAIVASSIIRLATKKSTFIFATHLHQLSKMERVNSLEDMAHFHLKVIYNRESKKLIYDRKLSNGSGDAVYGLEVAKALNLDNKFLSLAYDIRDEIMQEESSLNSLLKNPKKSIYNSKVLITKCEICGKRADEIHHILAQKNNLNEREIHHKSNLVALCKKHHKMVHSNELIIKGYRETSEGMKLDFEFK